MAAILRLVGLGVPVGVLLVAANLYLGLQIGLWDTGHLLAALLAVTALRAIREAAPEPMAAEVVTLAASMGAMPATIGLLGAIPALPLVGGPAQLWRIGLFGVVVGLAGVGLGLLARAPLLEQERLPFPSGAAAAEVLVAGGAGAAARRVRGLLGALGGSALFTAARDGLGWIPGFVGPPAGPLGPLGVSGLGLMASPTALGAGALIGPKNAGDLVIGALLGWVVLAPLLAGGPLDASAPGDWLMWPGVALMLGSSLVALPGLLGLGRRALADARALSGGFGRGWALTLVLALGLTARLAFGLSLGAVALGLPLAAGLGLLCARAAGLSDVAPLSQVGQVGQVVAAPLTLGLPAASLGVGSLAQGAGAQASVTLWSLRMGQVLSLDPRPQGRAALLGCLLGGAVSIPMYALFLRAWPLGSPALPAPQARVWQAIALAVTGGATLPSGAALACALALASGVGLTLLARRAPRLPNPMLLGLGLLLPLGLSLTIGLGAAISALARRRGADPQAASAVAAGTIGGESLAAMAVALGRTLLG